MESNTLALVAILALLAHAGHTLHSIGAVRARSAASVAAATLVGTATLLLLAYLLGQVLQWTYEDEQSGRPAGPGVYFLPATFVTIVPLGLLPLALCIGAGAERARVRALVIVSAALSVIVLPLIVALGWSLLSQADRQRPDGSYGTSVSLSAVARTWPAIVAHLVAAGGALALAKSIGPRGGKYNRDGSANFIPAHSLPTIIGGDVLLAVGIPMVAAALAGDPAARLVNAILAASAATLAAVVVDHRRHARLDAAGPWAAALAGLIAGSLSAPESSLIAIITGLVVGLLAPIVSLKADLKLRIDEPSGLAVPHLLGGLAGATAAAFSAALESGGGLVRAALHGSIGFSAAFIIVIGAIAVVAIVAIVLRQLKLLRVDEASEAEGLDLARHDINAYPDFQQTLIKSYHLRQ